MTALMLAAQAGDVEVVESLVMKGANAQIKNQQGKTVLDLAKNAKNKRDSQIVSVQKITVPHSIV